MRSAPLRCFTCHATVDVRTASARVAGARVVLVCSACRAVPPTTEERDTIPPDAEVMFVRERSRRPRDTSEPVAAEVTARRSRRSHAWMVSISGIAALAVLIVSHDRVPAEPSTEPASEPLAPRTITLEPATWTVLDLAPARTDGQWIHPVAGAVEILPTVHSRRFGAERPGKRPSHCRRGHCGVDLTGPRGTPIVAVLPGTVVRVEQSRESRSGRYVRIEHADGSSTSYMHLDRIAPGLEIGQEVDAGAMLGTLGRTGIHRSDPHLHFQIEVPRGKYHRFVDPEPMLANAVVIDVLDIELPVPDDDGDDTSLDEDLVVLD